MVNKPSLLNLHSQSMQAKIKQETEEPQLFVRSISKEAEYPKPKQLKIEIDELNECVTKDTIRKHFMNEESPMLMRPKELISNTSKSHEKISRDTTEKGEMKSTITPRRRDTRESKFDTTSN